METISKQRIHFDFSLVFQRTKEFIDGYNKRQVALTDKLNANHRATAELIVRLYLKQLNQAALLGVLDLYSLPGFATYNNSLASCKGCTNRTIINHKERLAKAGFILREEHCGKAGIALWINPEILDIEGKVKNLPPLVHELQEQDNNNSSVDKSGVPSGHEYGHGKPMATGTDQGQNKNMPESAAPAVNSQANCSEKSVESSIQEQGSAAGRIFLLSLVTQFWEYARKVLYPNLILSDPEEKEILNAIWASVFGRFQSSASEAEWISFLETAITRVNMVARWLSRSPGHWTPAPHLYFNPHNERNGFKKTWEWYLRQETVKIEIRNQLLIQQIKSEWDQQERGVGNFKDKSRLQLFRMQQKRLSKFKDERLNQVYMHCLQQHILLRKRQKHELRKT